MSFMPEEELPVPLGFLTSGASAWACRAQSERCPHLLTVFADVC